MANENDEWVESEMKKAMEKMLPSISGEKYMQTYRVYQNWRTENELSGPTNEKQLFVYLSHMLTSEKWVSPGTFWTKFSMLRSTILSQEGLNIKTTGMNATIQTWLKTLAQKHRLKQANMFTKEEVRRYLEDSPKSFVDLKLILLIGVYTGSRCDTISQLEWRHIPQEGDKVEVFIDYETKTDQAATGMWLSIPSAGSDSPYSVIRILQEYRSLVESKNKTP